jgi:aspartyl-tRNA(Asn)/glutamyl-tRNA(Gln) amidotransferase subunit A
MLKQCPISRLVDRSGSIRSLNRCQNRCRFTHSFPNNSADQYNSLCSAVKALQSGEATSTGLTRACVNQHAAYKHLNALITPLHDSALHSAAESDKRRAKDSPKSVLDGIPVCIKDNFQLEGVICSAGSKMLSNYHSPYDSTVVKKLKSAGAVIMGKTNLDEFGMGSHNLYSHYGPTINKHGADPNNSQNGYSAGGSSGGSAVSVSSGQSYASIGSDTGGSVRLPASYNGLVGYKPSYGSISRHGLIAYCSSMDSPGILARNVADAALVASVVQGYDDLDPTSRPDAAQISFNQANFGSEEPNLRGLLIGMPREFNIHGLSAEVYTKWLESASKLASLGAEIVEISLPSTSHALAAYYILAAAESSSNLSRYDGVKYGFSAGNPAQVSNLQEYYTQNRAAAFGSEVQRRILMGTFVLSSKAYNSYFNKAQQLRTMIIQEYQRVFAQKIAFILTPTALSAAPKISSLSARPPVDIYSNDLFTVAANLAGLAAMSVPAGVDSEGRPVGLQLMADYGQENQLFQAARALEFVCQQH